MSLVPRTDPPCDYIMADSLYELLAPDLKDDSKAGSTPQAGDPATVRYLDHLATLQLRALETSEPQALAHASHAALLSLQSLSTKSSKVIINSANELASLRTGLPSIVSNTKKLVDGIALLDQSAVGFSEKYSRTGENDVLDRRKMALLMSRNVDRISDILELPTLLASAISSSTAQGGSGSLNYASALDLHSHIKRLHTLYSGSDLLQSIYDQAEDALQEMTSNLIISLRGQSLKLAAGMKAIGWLRRIAPELDSDSQRSDPGNNEGALGALFLVCRLANLMNTLEALEPLRELAEQESQRRRSSKEQLTNGSAWSGGQQTERYLKRYIEIFREQSFAMISMFKSIFPAPETLNSEDLGLQFRSMNLKSPLPPQVKPEENPLQPIPSALATFPLHLVELLTETLRTYLPNVRDKSSRESLLTQVLYCAASLGRLGGDFSMQLCILLGEDEGGDGFEEWVAIMKKHRVLAGRLEQLASGTTGSGTAFRRP